MSMFRRAAFCIAAGLTCLSPLISRADTIVSGYLYASDYGAQTLDRFSYLYDETTKIAYDFQPAGANGSTTNAQFITGDVKEGLQGTASDIIVVASGGGSLTRYTLDGKLIGNIPITNPDGSSHTFYNIGNVQITPDGKYMYAPDDYTIAKIDLATGKVVNTVSFNGGHDVLVMPDGSIIAAGYKNGSGLWHFDANLSSASATQLAVEGTNGLSSPSGLSISKDGKTLYVQDNVKGSGGGISQYSVDPTTDALTFEKKITNPSLVFDFGTDVGPDGNLYISVLGSGLPQSGGSGFGNPPGFVNGIYEYNTSTDAVTQTVAGYDNSTGLPTNNFYSPKYIQFGFNFIPVADAGFPLPTPEPGAYGFLSGMALAGGLVAIKKRRSRN